MIRYLLAALALIASPALATEHIVKGADPTPHYQVYEGDTVVLGAAMGRELKADGTRDKTFPVWIDRTRGNGHGWAMDGATRLGCAVPVKSAADCRIYKPLDAKPAPVEAAALNTSVVVDHETPVRVTQPFGVNLAGCYAADKGALCPNADDIAWYTDPKQGFQLFRVAFKTSTPTATLYSSVNGLLAKGATVVMDRHEYQWPAVADQVAYWTALAAPYKANPKVIIDLMNEPRDFDSTTVPNDFMQWATDTKAIIAGLRKAGIHNTIAVEWPGSSGAQRIDKGEAAGKECASAACAVDRIGGLGDTNVLFETHYYWDKGSVGVSPNCDPWLFIDSARAAAAKRGWRLYLGEAAAGSWLGVRDTCKPLLDAAVAEIKGHPDTWFGVTWWGGGREWKESYVFKIEPTKGTRANVAHSAYLEKLMGK